MATTMNAQARTFGGSARAHSAKRLTDGRAMVNLGSSARVARDWTNIDFSWLVRLGRHRKLAGMLHQVGLLNDQRHHRIVTMDPDTLLWDLSKGVPFPDETFDVCYHSHVLEHIDHDVAPGFIAECSRVLKPGGILRVVVPDLEPLARSYLRVVDGLQHGSAGISESDHEDTVAAIFDQMVVRVPRHRRQESWIVRAAETLLIGDTARAGILHRWMYDRHSLARLLRECQFTDITMHTHATSGIAGWSAFKLDVEPDGSPYKPGSLYVEGRRGSRAQLP